MSHAAEPHIAPGVAQPWPRFFPSFGRPWGIFAALLIAVFAGYGARDTLLPAILAYTPLPAFARHSIAWGAFGIILDWGTEFAVILLAVWMIRMPLRDYLGWTRPRAGDVVLGLAVAVALGLLPNLLQFAILGKPLHPSPNRQLSAGHRRRHLQAVVRLRLVAGDPAGAAGRRERVSRLPVAQFFRLAARQYRRVAADRAIVFRHPLQSNDHGGWLVQRLAVHRAFHRRAGIGRVTLAQRHHHRAVPDARLDEFVDLNGGDRAAAADLRRTPPRLTFVVARPSFSPSGRSQSPGFCKAFRPSTALCPL